MEIRPRLKRVLLLFVTVLAASWLPQLSPLNAALLAYIDLIAWPVLAGLLIGGAMDYFVPDGYVVRHLGSDGRAPLVKAAAAGLLMSACSHGILAIAIQLHKKGAGVPAVITFLMASPWANLPVTILLFGFFGWPALYLVGGAVLIALASGLVFEALGRAGLVETNLNATPPSTTDDWDRLRNFDPGDAALGVLAGAVSLANRVLWWILIGVLVAALIGAYLPEHWFHDYLGPDLPGLLVTLLFATIIEVCSEGTSPVAFEIYRQTGALGNPFVFLLAGVATDYTEIGLLWSNIGKRTAIWLPVVTVPQILLYAWLLNRYVVT